MPFKARVESDEIKILRSLNTRMELTLEEQKYFLNKEKGFAGEVQFDLLTEKLQNCFILNDLLLEVNNTKFQIDSTLLFQKTISLFEVKNFEGDYIYEDEKFFSITTGSEISNPLDQLKRASSLFRQLLKKLGYHYNVEGYVVFINPEFYLYQAPKNAPIIYPAQLNRFMKKLDASPSKLIKQHTDAAERLAGLHQVDSPYPRLRPYTYQELRPGLTCKMCHSFSVSVCGRKLVCGDCGYEELVDAAVMRSVQELKLLFPDMKITTNIVHEWCGVVDSKKRISRSLGKNFYKAGINQWTFYE